MGRDMLVVDTFALSDLAIDGIAAESVKMLRLAALARACRIARRAAKKLDRYDNAPTLEREYRRALENVLIAAETYAGIEQEDDHG